MKLNLQKTDYKLALIVVTFLVVWQPVSLIAVFCLFIVQLKHYKSKLFQSKFFYLFLALTVYIIIKTVLAGQFIENFKYPKKLFILIIVFLSFYTFSIKIKQDLIKLFVWMMFLVQLYSIIHVFYFFYQNNLPFQGLNNFSYINSAIGFERPYIGFLSAMSIIFLLFNENIIIKKSLKFFLVYISLAYLIFISAKLASGISFLLLIIYTIKNRKWRTLISLVIISSILLFSFSKSLPIIDRFTKVLKDERVFLWNNSFQLINNDPNFSILFGSSNSSFRKIHAQLQTININRADNDEKKRYYKKMRKNIHNQYFEMYIFGGIIGVIFLVLPFFYLINVSLSSKNIVFLQIVIAILVFMFFENVLERQLGVITVALLTALNIKENKDQSRLTNHQS